MNAPILKTAAFESPKDTPMPPFKQLIARAGTLLRTQPILWSPPLGVALMSSLTIPAGAAVAVMAVVTALIGLAVTAGWYALIERADANQRPSWDDFFIAIGRHFVTLLLGTAVFAVLVGLIGVPSLLAGAAWAGSAALLKLQNQLPILLEQAQTHPEVLQNLDPTLANAVVRLTVGIAVGLTWYALVSVALLFWKQAVVIGNLSWWPAWRQSLSLLRSHFRLVMGLLTLQTIAYLAAAFVSALPTPIGILGWFLMIGVHVMATVTYTLVYSQAVPPVRTADADSPSPTGFAS
jgi:hypothetical protein